VSTTCPNPEQDHREQLFAFQAAGGQIALNDFMLPAKIATLWDNVETNEVKPTAVETNPSFSDDIFTLKAEP
jgi:hypothetical protein